MSLAESSIKRRVDMVESLFSEFGGSLNKKSTALSGLEESDFQTDLDEYLEMLKTSLIKKADEEEEAEKGTDVAGAETPSDTQSESSDTSNPEDRASDYESDINHEERRHKTAWDPSDRDSKALKEEKEFGRKSEEEQKSGVPTVLIDTTKVIMIIKFWSGIIGHNRPSLHVFPSKRIVSLALSPGCLMRPVKTNNILPYHYSSGFYVDSMIFNSKEMMQIYGYHQPGLEDIAEYVKPFLNQVPYFGEDEPPRPRLAAATSVQAIGLPRQELVSTNSPLHSNQPPLRTPLLDVICKEIRHNKLSSIPGGAFLVAFINMQANYEDSIIFSKKVNEYKAFAWGGGGRVHPHNLNVISTKLSI
ncbi:hypothetical protein HK100_000234 [Physocladia obscura]|uniref:Uncharacterized protein n=1 Tax=Physocladia obscura TaxID=109957 RepID=A0AAD5SZM4_9FUNG|nr:hypothetical protein HK100_000234 [Physocladia obscura]